MSASWNALERALESHAPALRADLRPGASDAALRALEQATGLRLTPEACALFAGHDGQHGQAEGVFFGLKMLSATEAAEEWARWQDVLRETPDLAEGFQGVPEGAVQPVYAHAGWLPFAHDGSGNHLALDFAPGPQGTPGQVISFGADEPTRYVWAPSAEAFLAWCAALFEDGRATGEGARVWLTAAPGHPFDALPALLG